MAEFDDEDRVRRQLRMAALFEAAREADYRLNGAPTPGSSALWFMGNAIEPDDVLIFDWQPGPVEGHDRTNGVVTAITEKAVVQLTYEHILDRPAQKHESQGSVTVLVRPLGDVQSVTWTAPELSASEAGVGNGASVVVHAETWDLTLSAPHRPYYTAEWSRFTWFTKLQRALGLA